MALADRGYFGLSKETTEGTALAPTKFLPVESVDFAYENEFIDYREIRGSRQAYGILDGPVRPSATIRGPLYVSGVTGQIFRGLLGANSAALESPSTTARRFTYTDAASLQTFTLERADERNGGGGLLCERVAGAKVERVSLSCAFGEKVDFEATFQATKTPVTATAVVSATVNAAYPVHDPMYFKGAAVKIDGSANNQFKSLNIEMVNTLTRLETLRGTKESYSIQPGGFSCNVSGTLVFTSLAEYTKCVNGTAMEITLDLVSDTMADGANSIPYSMRIVVDKVKISKYSIPFQAGETIEADVDFKAYYNAAQSRVIQLSTVSLDLATAYD